MKRLLLADLAETIKSNRIEKGITQEQLCKKNGNQPEYDWEN